MSGGLRHPVQHRPASLHRLPVRQEPHHSCRGWADALAVHFLPATAIDLAELFGSETGEPFAAGTDGSAEIFSFGQAKELSPGHDA